MTNYRTNNVISWWNNIIFVLLYFLISFPFLRINFVITYMLSLRDLWFTSFQGNLSLSHIQRTCHAPFEKWMSDDANEFSLKHHEHSNLEIDPFLGSHEGQNWYFSWLKLYSWMMKYSILSEVVELKTMYKLYIHVMIT